MIYILTILFCPLLSWIIAKRYARYEGGYYSLSDAYCEASRRRLEWLRRYEKLLPKARAHPDYLELWNREIGTQALLRIRFGNKETSYDGYRAEQEMLQEGGVG